VPLLTFLMLYFGWRTMFMIMGVAGLLMAAIWYLVYRNPTEVALTPEEDVYRTQGDPPGQRTKVTLREWRLLFRFRTTWGMILGYFGCIYLTWIYTAWLPGYLEIERHMSVKFTGWAAAVPFAWGVVGGVLGGYIVDFLVRRGVPPVESRRYPAAIALLGTAACTVAAAYVTSNSLAIVFISASLFLVYLTSTCAWALSSVAAPTNCTASIGAMQNFGGYLGGALAPTVTGLIVQSTGSFVPALVVGAVIAVAWAGSYLFIVESPITAMDMDAVSHPGAVLPRPRGQGSLGFSCRDFRHGRSAVSGQSAPVQRTWMTGTSSVMAVRREASLSSFFPSPANDTRCLRSRTTARRPRAVVRCDEPRAKGC
jgi:MFS family permease